MSQPSMLCQSSSISISPSSPSCMLIDKFSEYLIIGSNTGDIIQLELLTNCKKSSINTSLSTITCLVLGYNNDFWACGQGVCRFSIDLDSLQSINIDCQKIVHLSIRLTSLLLVHEESKIDLYSLSSSSSNTLLNFSGQAICSAFDDFKDLLAISSSDKVLSLISISQRKAVSLADLNSSVWVIKFFSKGEKIIVGDDEGFVKVMSSGNLEVCYSKRVIESRVNTFAISSDELFFAIAGSDGTCAWVDFLNFEVVDLVKGHQQAIQSIIYCDRNSLIVSAGSDMLVKVWKLKQMKVERKTKYLSLDSLIGSGLALKALVLVLALGFIFAIVRIFTNFSENLEFDSFKISVFLMFFIVLAGFCITNKDDFAHGCKNITHFLNDWIENIKNYRRGRADDRELKQLDEEFEDLTLN